MFQYSDVPKTLADNLLYRQAIIKSAHAQPLLTKNLLAASRKDFLWWLNTFCWVFEPRPEIGENGVVISKIKPFISWPHQDEAYHEMRPLWGLEDVGIIKSRGEGASWIVLMMMLHGWMFEDMEAYGLVSRNEDAADNPRDPNSLMWKLDWQIGKLPDWMICDDDYDRSKSDHTLVHHKTNSTIKAESATGTVARGGRTTAFLMDELASFKEPSGTNALDSTQAVTNCRVFLSTPMGPFGAYYEKIRNTPALKKIGMWWHQNPTKNHGLYRVKDNQVELVDLPYWCKRAGCTAEEAAHHAKKLRDQDENNPFGYAFWMTGEYVKDGALRSPWYDRECSRATSPRSIAQELDGDFGGSAVRFFNVQKLDELIGKCTKPIFKGDLLYETNEPEQGCRVLDGGRERFLVWGSFLLGNQKPVADHDYALGVDICAGLGGEYGSNSTIEVIDRNTRAVVAEYAAPDVEPPQWADIAAAMGYFFKGPGGPAVIIPERNGTGGGQFINRLRDLRYPHIYEMKVQDKRTKSTTKRLGFYSTKDTKPALLGEFSRALSSGELICHSRACLEEAKMYMLGGNGKVEHVAAANSSDPSGAGENHGDRVIAAACAWLATSEYGKNIRGKKANETTTFRGTSSMAGRNSLVQARERERSNNYW